MVLLAFCDVGFFLLGLGLAVLIYPDFAHVRFHTGLHAVPLTGMLIAIDFACLVAAGLYTRDAVHINARLLPHLATAGSMLVVVFAAFLIPYSWVHSERFSNIYAVVLFAAGVQLICSFFVRALLVDRLEMVGLKRRLLLMGANSVAGKVEAWFARGDRGYTDVIRYDSFRPERIVPLFRQSSAILKSLPDADLPQLARHHGIDEIVVADSQDATAWELLECRTRGVNVIDFLTFWERETGRIDLEAVEPRWLVYSGGFRTNMLRRISQRVLDIWISLLGLAITLPLMPIVALLIRIDSPGSIFYRQERIGKDDIPFQILKFRSMCENAEADDVPRWAQPADERVTRVGKILRLMRIDELPQLINVLKGEMSLVGPRPERPAFVHTFGQQIPFYSVRHSVRPGITGWAQINYEYTASLEDTKRKLEYDLFYVKNQSLFLDLAIVLQTLRIVLWQHGAR